MASFAQRQLEKYGWQKGEALGKTKDGIKKPISASMKSDTSGLGAKQGEWSFSWWDHVFNKTTASIKIETDDSGDIKVAKALQQDQKKQQQAMLYGSFVKSSGIEAAKETIDENKDYSIRVSDKDLLEACEGRTARKGARAHQPGKLKRTHHDIVKYAADTPNGEANSDSNQSAALDASSETGVTKPSKKKQKTMETLESDSGPSDRKKSDKKKKKDRKSKQPDDQEAASASASASAQLSKQSESLPVAEAKDKPKKKKSKSKDLDNDIAAQESAQANKAHKAHKKRKNKDKEAKHGEKKRSKKSDGE